MKKQVADVPCQKYHIENDGVVKNKTPIIAGANIRRLKRIREWAVYFF